MRILNVIRPSVLTASFAVALTAFVGTRPAHADFNYPNFSSTAGLQLNGAATTVGNVLRLTASGQSSVSGSAFTTAAQNVAGGFTATFTFQITQPAGITDENGLNGADGIAFNIQNTGANQNVFTTSQFSLLFDTYDNGGGDPSSTFARLFFNNVAVATTDLSAASATPINFTDGNAHTVQVLYSGTTVNVSLDGTGIISAGGIDMSTFSPAFVGFGSFVGGASENHDILSASLVTTAAAAPEPGSCALLATVLLPAAGVLVRRRYRQP